MASSHMTGKAPSGSERLQLGGVSPRVVVKKNCTKDVEWHTPQVLLQLNKQQNHALFPRAVIFSLRRVFDRKSFDEAFLFKLSVLAH